MFDRLKKGAFEYPKQFWLMFGGMILSITGATMIWPFLMIFVSEKLSLPLMAVASLMTISSVIGLLSSIAAGPIVDRLGRKPAMVVGLIGTGLSYFLLSWAESYLAFAIILGLNGVFSPLYKVGSDSMLADLIPMGKRADAFALIRMGRNIGVAVGPALGGFVLAQSYDIGLYGAAVGFTLFGALFLFFARETIPPQVTDEPSSLGQQLKGYWTALKDRPFMGLVGAFTLVQMTASLVWVLLSVYVKTNYGVSERLYGWLPTTNALMVVFLQVLITRRTKRFNPVKVMRWGSVFYIAAPFVIAYSTSFWGFWSAMVIMTLGELIVVPRTSAFAANLAPIDKRGRYMSLYGLSWNVASGVSPLLGGFLSDQFGSQATWFGGAIFGLLAVIAFSVMESGTKSENDLVS
jgi:MFS family permease